MSAQSYLPVTGLTNEIVDLTEGMSDLDVDQQSATDPNEDGQDTNDISKPRKKRRKGGNRRGGKGKKSKALETTIQVQDGQSTAANEGTSDSSD
jgi:hypothetical protein